MSNIPTPCILMSPSVSVISWACQCGKGRLRAKLPSMFRGWCACLPHCQVIPRFTRRWNDAGELQTPNGISRQYVPKTV